MNCEVSICSQEYLKLRSIYKLSTTFMEGRKWNYSSAGGPSSEYKRHRLREAEHRANTSNYFTAESFLVLLFLTASLLILPLILPPLPPPPFMLLLLPIGILIVLVIMAFMPSDRRRIASSYM